MKRNKRDYTNDERKKILDYIIDNEGFCNLRGISFWKQMEKENVLERTWQSMKEHFRMKIIPNLMAYDVSKEHQKKILEGYNKTRTVDKTDNRTVVLPKHNKNLDFSDEEHETEKSTSSDESDNLVTERNKNNPSTSRKKFGKQSIKKRFSYKRKSTCNRNRTPSPIQILEESDCATSPQFNKEIVSVNGAHQQNDMIEAVATSPSITGLNSDNTSDKSINVSSTNIDETYIEFSLADDKKFLQAITKYDSNLQCCASIVTFIKQYTDYYDIVQRWTELYDRFIEILNNLQLYDFLAPEIVTKLQKLREPLEKYRSDGFQEPKIEILLDKETFNFALVPDTDLIYVKKESLDLVSCLENIRTSIYEIVEKTSTGHLSVEAASDLIKTITEFHKNYVSQRSSDNNENNGSGENLQIVKEEIDNNDYPDIQIKEENTSLINDEDNATFEQESNALKTKEDNQSILSDTICIQPEITLNLSEIQCNSIQTSQYLESFTTTELNVTNIVGQMIENDLNQSDLDFLTCETNL